MAASKKDPAWVMFGQEVRHLRNHRGWTLQKLAAKVHLSTAMLSALERATRKPKRYHIEALDAIFEQDGALLSAWANTTRNEMEPAWYRQVVSSEERAVEIRTYHPFVVPGLFQCADYARLLFRGACPTESPEQIEQYVNDRVRRLDALAEGINPLLWAIVPEAVIRDVVGGPAVMRSQLERLLQLSERQTVRLQVLSAKTPVLARFVGAFRVLAFRDRLPMVYVEHECGGELITESAEVRRLTTVFGELQSWALSPGDSADLISSIRGGLD